MSKLYPIGIQNFESLRKDGYFYVDKTRLIYQLVKTGRYYFLSRPRRFGKSLLISTLEAYYQGKKELFEGLAIEQLEKDWIKHPILHLDLNNEKYDTPKVSTEYSMITWRNGRACTAHAHRKYLSPCVLQVSYNVLTNRPDNVSLSLWMNMTNPCCKLSEMKSYRSTSEIR